MGVACIILAAGAGRRAGGPKAFAVLRDPATGREEPYLVRVARVAREGGCSPLLAVVRPGDLARAQAAAPGLALAVNPDPERGMLSSLQAALDALPPLAAVLAFPVDHPEVCADTVRALLAVAASAPGAVVKPVREGRGGHPVLIPWAVAESLPAADREGGLAAALRESGAPVVELPVDDPGVLRNRNGPEDR